MKAARAVCVLIVLVAVVQVVHYRSLLPGRMASHFDGTGRANGFMFRDDFLATELGLFAFMSLIFVVLPGFLRRIPNSLINLPRKDYWLAPERREATLRDMARQLTWFGAATLLFLLLVMEAVMRANLPGGGGQLSAPFFYTSLGIYLSFVAFWTIPLLWKHSRLPARSDHGRSSGSPRA